MHEVLRSLPYGIYVVGVRGLDESTTNALVVSWLTQCSFDPPLLMMALRHDSRSLELLREGQVFSVNLIDAGQEQLARQFVKPADRVGDKLGSEARAGEKTRAPVLRDALATLECRVHTVVEPGDHAIVVGEVVGAERREGGRPLVCADLHWIYGG